MRLIVSVLLTLTLNSVLGQLQQSTVVSKDTSKFPPKYDHLDPIPNPMMGKQPGFVQEGNNGNGLDIYKSKLDNMSVLAPDKSFKSNMPTGKNKFLTLAPPQPVTIQDLEPVMHKDEMIKVTPSFGQNNPNSFTPSDSSKLLDVYKKNRR